MILFVIVCQSRLIVIVVRVDPIMLDQLIHLLLAIFQLFVDIYQV